MIHALFACVHYFFNTGLSKSAFIWELVFIFLCFMCFLCHECWIWCHIYRIAAYNHCFCKCHLVMCDFALTWWKLSICKTHIIKIWFWHKWLAKKICFHRGFELIKNHLRKKCGTVTKHNKKISLVKEIYKVKNWK